MTTYLTTATFLHCGGAIEKPKDLGMAGVCEGYFERRASEESNKVHAKNLRNASLKWGAIHDATHPRY